ncbi:MAG: hypothetical protein GX113_04145 [Actinobacteria bacterium]|nr:hypothetical protein [Actinomycetota bacterium]
MDSSQVVLDRYPECGRLIRRGQECPICAAGASKGYLPQQKSGKRAGSGKRWWILPVCLVVLVAVGMSVYMLRPKTPTEQAVADAVDYQERFRSITLSLADASMDLQATLQGYPRWESATLIRMRALVGIISDGVNQARSIRPPPEGIEAHSLLMHAAGHYDLGVQQTLSALRTAGSGNGDVTMAFDAARSLMQADQYRIKAQAALGRGVRGMDP